MIALSSEFSNDSLNSVKRFRAACVAQLLLFALILAFSGSSTDGALAASPKSPSGLKKSVSTKKVPHFYQTRLNTAMWGAIDVFVGDFGLRMDFRKNGNVLLAVPPLWKVVMYNASGKRIYYHQRGDWDGGTMQKYLQMMSRSPRDLLWVKESSDGSIAIYKSDKPAPMLSRSSKKRLQRFVMRARLTTDVATPGLPKAAISILDKTLGCPDVEGFPLSMNTTSSTNEQNAFVEISRGFKEIPFDKRLFELPKNFEKVDSDGKVESASAEALINDMAN